MKSGVTKGTIALFCLLFTIGAMGTGIAETKYVVQEMVKEITMRTGPGKDYRIIALVPSGRQVEVLDSREKWSQVRLTNEKEGWVLSQYLSDAIPNEMKLERIEKKYTQLLNQKTALDQDAAELGSAKRELSETLAQTQAELADLAAAHETLQNDSADFINLKKNFNTTVKELNNTRAHAEKVENELNRLSNSQVYQGMLYGGGLLALGFIVGFIVKRPKRRSPLL